MKRMSQMLVPAMAMSALPAMGQSGDRGLLSDMSTRSGRMTSKRTLTPVRELLQKKVDRVEWFEQPFSDVIDWLRAQSSEGESVNVIAKWKALNVESVDFDSPVTLNMSDTSVKEVLDEVLDQLTDIDPLTYVGMGNRLKISTKSDFDQKLYTRVYDIADVLLKVRNFTGSPQIDLQQQQQGGGGGGGSGGQVQVQSIFGGSGGGGEDEQEDDDDEEEERAEEIIAFIEAVVEPDIWVTNGGLSSMRIFNKLLIVRSTLTVHEMLGGPFHFDE